MNELNGIYDEIRLICISLLAIAAVIGGIRIFQRWNQGQEGVESSLIHWFGALATSYGLVELVDFGIKSPFGYVGSDNAAGVIRDAAPEVYQAGIYLGIVFTVVGIIRVFIKVQNGDEDIYEFALKWLGSLMFLFLIGYIINLTFSKWA
jgi:hypothetical protein